MGAHAGELLPILALPVLQASHGHHVTGGAGSVRVISPLQAVQGSPEKGAWPVCLSQSEGWCHLEAVLNY